MKQGRCKKCNIRWQWAGDDVYALKQGLPKTPDIPQGECYCPTCGEELSRTTHVCKAEHRIVSAVAVASKRAVSDEHADEYCHIHSDMGCHTCFFADRDKLDIGPCCTNMMLKDTAYTKDKCPRWRERES